MTTPIVAIVGRPNVGKSNLFNRIVEQRVSIVEDVPGVTRDRLYADAFWTGHRFILVDTGGFLLKEVDAFTNKVSEQVKVAISEADSIIFLVDGKEGITSYDEEVAKILRETDKPIILGVNKVDNMAEEANIYEFYKLGFGDPIPVSAIHGRNVGDLLDEVVRTLPDVEEVDEEDIDAKVAVVGRPNVGKSTLVNKLIGEERTIVSDIPGTTRDAIDITFLWNDKKIVLVDTAGLRRKSKISDAVERYSTIRTLRAIERCDVAVTLIDAVEGLTDQDKRIAGYAHELGRAAIIVVNKWDLVEKDHTTFKAYERMINEGMPFMTYAPILFLSAFTGQRVHRLSELILKVVDEHKKEIQTAALNSVIREAIRRQPPPSVKNKVLKIYYATQVKTGPPSFLLFVNDPKLIHFSYKRYLENKIREAFGFEGTPISLCLRRRK